MAEDLTNSFQIPSAAPSGEAVFAWSWFNRLGNREMYHVSTSGLKHFLGDEERRKRRRSGEIESL